MSRTRAKTAGRFQRYRRSKQLIGMRLLQIWVPDSRSAAFEREVKRELTLLRRAPEQVGASRFIQAATDWPSL